MNFLEILENLFLIIGDWLAGLLATFLPAWAVQLAMDFVDIILLLVIAIVAVLVLSLLERKVAARIGDRYGPNRWGPFGIFQPIADALKMLTKEDIVTSCADRFIFNLAPALAAIAAVMTYAVIPFGKDMVAVDLNIGILYFAAIGSLSALGILCAGWGSNNKFSLISGFRAVAQLISYEIPLGLSIIVVVMLTGSLSTQDIVAAQQARGWFALLLPAVFLIFFMASSAEMIRGPFDLIEADSEIVSGHMTEYSGMKFALFFLAEYIHLFAGAGIITTLFLGGWSGPILPSWMWFFIKTFVVILIFMWVRNSWIRIRIDHILNFSWKVLVPAGFAALFLVGIVDRLFRDQVILSGIALFLVNIALILAVSWLMGWDLRRQEQAAAKAALGGVEKACGS